MKGAKCSISTFSVTTKRLLRCFRGGLSGSVSFGPGRSLLIAGFRFASVSDSREGVLERASGASGLTTTTGVCTCCFCAVVCDAVPDWDFAGFGGCPTTTTGAWAGGWGGVCFASFFFFDVPPS